jgi:hypothetical protein
MILEEPSLFAPIAEWRDFSKLAERLGEGLRADYARHTIAMLEARAHEPRAGADDADSSPAALPARRERR